MFESGLPFLPPGKTKSLSRRTAGPRLSSAAGTAAVVGGACNGFEAVAPPRSSTRVNNRAPDPETAGTHA